MKHIRVNCSIQNGRYNIVNFQILATDNVETNHCNTITNCLRLKGGRIYPYFSIYAPDDLTRYGGNKQIPVYSNINDYTMTLQEF